MPATDLNGLFAQRGNLLRPRFWSMLRDLLRFYRAAPVDARRLEVETQSLGDYLAQGGYGEPFIRDHLLPMAAAIWSAPADRMADHPAAAFLRFCDNHGLLQLRDRPQWRSVTGGARAYIARLTADFADRIRLGSPVTAIRRRPDGVELEAQGRSESFDHVVIAAHADQALRMLRDPSIDETRLLGAIPYGVNHAVMHRDPRLMPRRRAAWCSWNYIGGTGNGTGNGTGEGAGADHSDLCATYWMNRLQGLPGAPIFVTLNPPARVAEVVHRETYEHPQFDGAALRAQRQLWALQGVRRTGLRRLFRRRIPRGRVAGGAGGGRGAGGAAAPLDRGRSVGPDPTPRPSTPAPQRSPHERRRDRSCAFPPGALSWRGDPYPPAPGAPPAALPHADAAARHR